MLTGDGRARVVRTCLGATNTHRIHEHIRVEVSKKKGGGFRVYVVGRTDGDMSDEE